MKLEIIHSHPVHRVWWTLTRSTETDWWCSCWVQQPHREFTISCWITEVHHFQIDCKCSCNSCLSSWSLMWIYFCVNLRDSPPRWQLNVCNIHEVKDSPPVLSPQCICPLRSVWESHTLWQQRTSFLNSEIHSALYGKSTGVDGDIRVDSSAPQTLWMNTKAE